MPSHDFKQNKLRDFIAQANNSLTVTEFNARFRVISSFIRTAIADLNSSINTRLAELKDGYTPVKGKDYFDGKPGKDGKTPIAGIDFPFPKDGTPGKDADEPAIVARVKAELLPEVIAAIEQHIPALGIAIHDAIKLLPEADRPHISLFQGLEGLVKELFAKNLGALGPGGGTSFAILQSGTQKVQQPLALNFKGTGAPTITLGQNGVTHLDFPGGGSSGTAVYDEIPTGSGTSFSIAHTPTAGTVRLFRGGARQSVANGDYSISGANITLITSLQSGETLTADYNY